MKLEVHGCEERYTIEQSLLNLFPGELPVYGPVQPEDESWAVFDCLEDNDGYQVDLRLSWNGRTVSRQARQVLTGTAFQREGQRRHIIGSCFFLAYRELTGNQPPWGMLTGVRPDKLVTEALSEGGTPEEARALLESRYYVTPPRAALAVETGTAAFQAAGDLGPKDIAVYIGIPFCPTRCAYCSFVSQSVERSFALVEPYVDALAAELAAGGRMARERGLRVRAMYMGGGTPAAN